MSGVTMRAARCNAHGPPESILLEEMPIPETGRGEVLVEVQAASVNFPDTLICANLYQVSVPTPFTPGSEFAGVVREVGEGVGDFAIGDRVVGAAMTGAFAEQIVVPAAALTPMAPETSFADAASFGVTGRTAYIALHSVAQANEGEWVVVSGAAGGLGSAALDIARTLGCRTIAIASNEEKLAACLSWGADEAILAGHEDLKGAIRAVTGGGADIVIDPVGGALAETLLRAMRYGGRFVTLGFASGEIPKIPLNLVLLKGVDVRGLDVRTYPENDPERARQDAEEFRRLVADGLRPRIGAAFKLTAISEALSHVAAGRAIGKVVIEMS
jgi:NADPH:quinone reductase